MELKEILSISGMPGLYKLMASRDNGLIVSALGDEKKKFVSSRQHMFTPVENITIYTQDDSESLIDILKRMKKQEKETPLVKPNSKGDELRAYFTKVAPDHDQEKVYTSDIKKIIKWYHQLDENGYMKVEKPAKKAKAAEKKTEKSADKKKASKPKAKSSSKTKK